ncbi:hypothetical protein [Shinella sp.]|uniref:hypothetical protein n=1 Tax=Shinella sp. TaxID=1870904 RepID=UPI00258DA20E|nr:hypothetical protein [Shinella sp.]MCW5706080.1 hypothetical protein [Shinella sp.]
MAKTFPAFFENETRDGPGWFPLSSMTAAIPREKVKKNGLVRLVGSPTRSGKMRIRVFGVQGLSPQSGCISRSPVRPIMPERDFLD